MRPSSRGSKAQTCRDWAGMKSRKHLQRTHRSCRLFASLFCQSFASFFLPLVVSFAALTGLGELDSDPQALLELGLAEEAHDSHAELVLARDRAGRSDFNRLLHPQHKAKEKKHQHNTSQLLTSTPHLILLILHISTTLLNSSTQHHTSSFTSTQHFSTLHLDTTPHPSSFTSTPHPSSFTSTPHPHPPHLTKDVEANRFPLRIHLGNHPTSTFSRTATGPALSPVQCP